MIETLKLEKQDHENKTHKEEKTKSERRQPIDMKLFWKNLDETYFKNPKDLNTEKINHLIMNLSTYDLKNDSTYSKFGFPKNLDNFITKPYDLAQKQNNPYMVCKFFGMYLYVDKYDYVLNNINTGDIDDEIFEIEKKIGVIEVSNLDYFDRLRTIIKTDIESKDVNLDDPMVTAIKKNNICNQILNLQLKQLSECIYSIKKDLKGRNYMVVFDKAEELDTLNLEESIYKSLMKYRDIISNVSVYDLFLEKSSTVYNNNKNTKEKSKGKKSKSSKKKKVQETQISIANNIHIKYEFCHHCKQKKPTDIMVKCESHNYQASHLIKNYDKNYRYCNINEILSARKFTNFIITNFSGDPKDLIDNYLNNNYKYTCHRYYCSYCLKGNYEVNLEQIKPKEWICPCCEGSCFCTRCKRNDQILKLISLYLTLDGSFKDIERYLINNSQILAHITSSLITSNIVFIDGSNLANINSKKETKGKNDCKKIKGLEQNSVTTITTKSMNNLILCQERLRHLQKFYSGVFKKNKDLRAMQYFDQTLEDLGNEVDENQGEQIFLKKKKKRNEKNVSKDSMKMKRKFDLIKQNRKEKIKSKRHNIKFRLRDYTKKKLRIKKKKSKNGVSSYF